MGGNVSKETEMETIQAYTFYGFGCTRCRCPTRRFVEGAPRENFCGTSCTSITFDPPPEYDHVLGALELQEAAQIASRYISWMSHVLFSPCDASAERAAKALNEEWCPTQNEALSRHDLYCQANHEIFGFGRSRVTYLVIRIKPLANKVQSTREVLFRKIR